ncbi:putative secreted protein (Por secretion system target) [Mucilaginibacter yixingensis]|uniref:Putative secreted protein (Por secretion system target) n=1 Tax=Mucilaginibacter yixingensis TaxID=1295612 RepID=A0A2T5J5V8_9SPHI|nr:GDSL-type esterase/lipase family protein [Mucilaginibacter yixingensis]PTQ93600.1 putative secreted protein (Por secretion system target) [Mucilaginibacter yixingensis]
MVICLTSWAQTPSCSAASKFYSKDSINVTAFGASTVAGIGGFSFEGFLQQNIENCYTGKTVTVTNNGVPGETTTQGLVRFPAAIQGRTGFLLILMGANDAQAIVNKKMKLSETERNMRYYIEEGMKHNLIPILGTIQFYNDKDSQFFRDCNLWVKQINSLYKRLALEYHIYLADINLALGRNFALYQDLVHPNEQGFRLVSFVWFDAINRAIEDKLLVVGVNQNYPNPVSADGKTRIGYSLSQASHVQMKLYSMLGAQVMQLADEYQGAGYHEVQANLTNLKAGVYVYVLRVGGQQFSKKMLVVK